MIILTGLQNLEDCIYLCATSRVQDIETSWHNNPRKGHPLFSPFAPRERVYYSVRNYSCFELSQLTPSRFIYFINMFNIYSKYYS